MDKWNTFTFEFQGGLITSLSPIQHGTKFPGSARILTNFEPSITGGYRKIKGYEKFDNNHVPVIGSALVQGSGQTGNSLLISGVFENLEGNETFTISGVTGTYTVVSHTYDASYKQATLIITPSLSSSPADKASITFNNSTTSHLICGISSWRNTAIANRSGNVYTSSGSGWTRINMPNLGTLSVNGAGQTGTTLNVTGFTKQIYDGYLIHIAGIEKTYTVIAATTVASGNSTLTIYPALISSPANGASVTIYSNDFSCSTKSRFERYSLNNVEKLVCSDGVSNPFIWNGSVFEALDSPDISGSHIVKFFKNQLFFAKNNNLYFTSPYTDNDFNAANGAGVISVDGDITGLVTFRESLFIFTQKTISRLTGNTSIDFVLQPVTRSLGCVATDTIQEIGGDVIFLGPDGLRLLSATDRIGDFSLGVVSKNIQAEMTRLISSSSSFSSLVIKSKSQYRLFGYSTTVPEDSASGIIGVQKEGQNSSAIEWSKTIGIKVFVASSDYYNQQETILFSNTSGYVYSLDEGNSFDGKNIKASFATPYVTLGDPRIRKTLYKLLFYVEPEGSINMTIGLKFDIDTKNIIQPSLINISTSEENISFYNENTYNNAYYGDKVTKLFLTQTVGSGFNVSILFETNGITAPFTIDAATLEFSSHDRR